MGMLGVTFGEKHSLGDWGLLLKELPSIAPPEPKTQYIDIPGGDGQLDLTESLTGDVHFENRQIICTFLSREPECGWPQRFSEIQDYIHGQQMQFRIDNDPGYYYIGRFSVSEWSHDGFYYAFKIEGSADPYKYEIVGGMDDWLWDPFSFVTGVVREYRDIVVNGNTEITIIGSRKKVRPEFVVTSKDGNGMTLAYDGTIYILPDGRSTVPAIIIGDGEYVLTFSGNGLVSVDYRGGCL